MSGLPQPVPLNRQSTLDNAHKFISETKYTECELPIESKEYNVLADIIKRDRLQPLLDQIYSTITSLSATIFVAGKTKVNDKHNNYYINTFINFKPFNSMRRFTLRDSLRQEAQNALPIHLSFHSEDPTKGGNKIHIKTDECINSSPLLAQYYQEIQYKIVHNKEATGIDSDKKIKFVLEKMRGTIHDDFKIAADELIDIIESLLNTDYVDNINTIPIDINSFIRFSILVHITDMWIQKHIRDIREITTSSRFNLLSSDERSDLIKPISDKVFSKVNSIKGHIKSFAEKIKSDMDWLDNKNIDIINKYTDYIKDFYSVYIEDFQRQPIYNDLCKTLLSRDDFNILEFITSLQTQQNNINTLETDMIEIQLKIKRHEVIKTMEVLSLEQIAEADSNARQRFKLSQNISKLKQKLSNNITCLIIVVDKMLKSGEHPLVKINDLINLQDKNIIEFIKTIIQNIELKSHYPSKSEIMTTLDYYNLLVEHHISNPVAPVAASPRQELSRCVGDVDVVLLARTLSNSFTDYNSPVIIVDTAPSEHAAVGLSLKTQKHSLMPSRKEKKEKKEDKKRLRVLTSLLPLHEESIRPIATNTLNGEQSQYKRLKFEQKYLKYKNKYLQLRKKLLN